VDLEYFESLVCGYLEVTRDFLNPVEIELLPFSGMLITLTIGIRFSHGLPAGRRVLHNASSRREPGPVPDAVRAREEPSGQRSGHGCDRGAAFRALAMNSATFMVRAPSGGPREEPRIGERTIHGGAAISRLAKPLQETAVWVVSPTHGFATE